jgi:large subunit ribosomal protein L25
MHMEKTILKASPRTEKPRKLRRTGFVPGVLNASDTTSTPVQFEAAALNKVIERHGPNAKVWVDLDKKKHFGYIKEIQKQPVDWTVTHVSIQLVEQDQEVKMHLPIYYHGREELEHRLLMLQVNKSEVEVIGKAGKMPESIVLDVSKLENGVHLTSADFNLPKGLRLHETEHETYAVVRAQRELPPEETVAKPAEPAAATETPAPKA